MNAIRGGGTRALSMRPDELINDAECSCRPGRQRWPVTESLRHVDINAKSATVDVFRYTAAVNQTNGASREPEKTSLRARRTGRERFLQSSSETGQYSHFGQFAAVRTSVESTVRLRISEVNYLAPQMRFETTNHWLTPMYLKRCGVGLSKRTHRDRDLIRFSPLPTSWKFWISS